MADPTGGSNAAIVTIVTAIVSTVAAVVGVVVAIIRKGGDGDAQDVIDAIRLQALMAKDADYDAQTAYVHQLQAFIHDRGLPVPMRKSDD